MAWTALSCGTWMTRPSRGIYPSVIKEVGNAVYNVIGQYLDNGTLPFGEYEIWACPTAP
ncbi:MAG: hypothetical protein ACLTJE_17735 [Enterocloster bolteae]|uniref:hypothetical protein n=1 Tax=Enterocloster bolteae TaxID=208479 RepID=UPI003996330D